MTECYSAELMFPETMTRFNVAYSNGDWNKMQSIVTDFAKKWSVFYNGPGEGMSNSDKVIFWYSLGTRIFKKTYFYFK